MPDSPLSPLEITSAFVLFSERALLEADGVPSLIRVIDTLWVNDRPDLPMDARAVGCFIIGCVRFRAFDGRDHVFQFNLIRPSGEAKLIEPPHLAKLVSKSNRPAGSQEGINVINAVAILPKEMGAHYVTLLMDGVEIARTGLTLAPAPITPPPHYDPKKNE